MCPESFTGCRFDLGPLLQGKDDLRKIICPESYGGVTFDLGPLLQGGMWSLIPLMACISLTITHAGFGCEDNL